MRTLAVLALLLVAVLAGCGKAGLATNPEDRVKQIEEIVRQYAPPDRLPQPNRNVQYQGESNGPQGTVRITGEFQEDGQWLEKQAVVPVQWNDHEGKWIITSSVPEFSLTDAEAERQATAQRQREGAARLKAQLRPHTAPQKDATVGRDDAPVTMVVFFRFDCSHCADFALQTQPLIEDEFVNTGKLRIEFRPLAPEGDVLLASEAAACAGDQGRYWDYHDLLFASRELGFGHADLGDYAVEMDLDTDAFSSCLDSGKHQEEITRETSEATQAGVNATPTFFVGKTSAMRGLTVPYPGQTQIVGAEPYAAFREAIENVLPKTQGAAATAPPIKQWAAPPPMSIDPAKSYTATIKTGKGSFQVELFAKDAPNTVNNFVFLARQGYYDDVPFHYVQPDFSVQTGDPTGTGTGGPGYEIAKEPNSHPFDEGTLGMVNGSQFFIVLQPSKQFDTGDFWPFGKVVAGMDVVRQIAQGDRILGIDITEQ